MPTNMKNCMYKQVGRVAGSTLAVSTTTMTSAGEFTAPTPATLDTTVSLSKDPNNAHHVMIREESSIKSSVDDVVSSPTPSSSSASLSLSDDHHNHHTTHKTTSITPDLGNSSSSSSASKNACDWTALQVKTWLESIGMLPFQVKNAMKTLKNGKSLLAMNDNELERTFALNNSMHRRKLRLAIDELKSPEKR